MALADTAEYWQDVKDRPIKHIFTHVKGKDCGHYHVIESDELDLIDCFACKKIIESDNDLKTQLETNNGKRQRKYKAKQKNKKGYKLDSIIKFGKFKEKNKSIKWLINNEPSYFNWLKDKILLHSEVDRYLKEYN